MRTHESEDRLSLNVLDIEPADAAEVLRCATTATRPRTPAVMTLFTLLLELAQREGARPGADDREATPESTEMTTAACAEALGLSRRRVIELVHEGALDARRWDGRLLVDARSLSRLLARRLEEGK